MKLFAFFILLAGMAYGQHTASEPVKNMVDTFPVPKDTKHTLFYVQRTHNTNTIMYELNYNADSTINIEEPVKIYWIRYADNGELVPLSYIQRHYAYGIEAKLLDSAKKTFRLNFVSYKKRDIFLMPTPGTKSYQAFISINGKLAVFNRAFAKIDGGTLMLPHIAYVEISGKDMASGKKVSERIIP